jgi:hypothetical protein
LAEYTPGRFVLAVTDHDGSRDVISIMQQVKKMRGGMLDALHRRVGLIIIVVQEDQRGAAVERIQAALDDGLNGSPT